jgi:hypothetical protein
VSSETAARNPDWPGVGWYIRTDQRIHEDPDWAYRWVAMRIDGPSDVLKAQYREMVDALYGHPDRERGSDLAWQLHDAVRAFYAEREWLRRYPAKDGAFKQSMERRGALGLSADTAPIYTYQSDGHLWVSR